MSPAPIGPEESTPDLIGGGDEPKRRRHTGNWAPMTTGEYQLAQTVAKRERRVSWWKAIGVAGGAIAVVQFFNSAGPCSTGWKFQTTDAAAKRDSQVDDWLQANTAEHATMRQDLAVTKIKLDGITQSLDRVERKLKTK
jgi:hypothetical protein